MINVRITLDSYDFAHPSEKQTQVYLELPEVARVSYMLPAHFYTSMRDQEWGDVLDNAHGYYESSCAVTDSDSARARAAVREWLAVDENRDELNVAWFQDRARRDPVSRSLLKDVERLRARVAELEVERVAGNAALADLTVALRVAEGRQSPDTYPPAFPWARWLDAEDRADFLDELAASAITHVDSVTALAEVETTCGSWRAIADATRAHLTAPGPNCTCSEPVANCAGGGCGCPVCHRAVALAADEPVPYELTAAAATSGGVS
ncbi:hypothetical protein [Streptomyces cucumeris]|uniref:hypothetical protein n=1 Tax=Streptomyces cucumeris TaxID=2962890 RepID=UPI0020C8C221|nr:hypothetical protein [Streptomyces sp. NEAU-Y11]MCP9205555.1 hypothetical protein [Streptomyces sp. NEAU-Y11]